MRQWFFLDIETIWNFTNEINYFYFYLSNTALVQIIEFLNCFLINRGIGVQIKNNDKQ